MKTSLFEIDWSNFIIRKGCLDLNMENFQRVTAFEKSSLPIPCNKLPKVKEGGLPLCLKVTLEGILKLLTPTFMKPRLSVGRLLGNSSGLL